MYVDKVLKDLQGKLLSEDFEKNEFYQAVEEVLTTLRPVLTDKHETIKALERLTQPDFIAEFKVVWERDDGTIEVNTGYRVQFNATLGYYKGGLRFHPSVNRKILKFLAFEQIFKNSLTGLPMGGAKGGSDFDPKGKSESEIRRFCYAFAEKLNPHIGSLTDVPAGDIGVSARELGYIYGKLKQLRNKNEFGILTGKPVSMGGSKVRKEATGYGVVFFLLNILKQYQILNEDLFPSRKSEHYVQQLREMKPLTGQKVVVSGSGNVAIYAAEKIINLGGTVLAMSDSQGTIIDENGIELHLIKEIKEEKRDSIKVYKDLKDSITDFLDVEHKVTYIPKSEYVKGQHPIWNVKGTDIALPCATQNELNVNDVRHLHQNGCKVIVEGANMPTTSCAIDYINENIEDIIYAPGKASNAGGVATSFLEMSQNASMESWDEVTVEKKLSVIMNKIFENCHKTATDQGQHRNLAMGANIYSFNRIIEGMENQGIIS